MVSQFKAVPGLDALAKIARQMRREIPATGLPVVDDRKLRLRAAAVACGIDDKIADNIICTAFEKAAAEIKTEAASLPERVAIRAACAEIRDNRSLEQVRSAV